MHSDQRLNFQYLLILSGYYAGAACFLGYVVPTLQKQGFDSLQIGLLLGVRALFSVMFQPIFAKLMEKYEAKFPLNYLVSVMILMSMGITVAQLLHPGFILTIGIFIMYGIFTFSMITFIDSMSTRYYQDGKKVNYPLARGSGSFAYAICSLFVGRLLTAEALLTAQLILFIPLLLLVATIEKPKAIQLSDELKRVKRKGILDLLKKYPMFAVFVLAIVFSFIGKEMAANFLIDVYKSLGGNSADYGTGMFLLALSEVPVAIIFTRLLDKLGIYKLMMVSFLVATLRIFFILMAPSVPVLIAVQALQMFGNGLFWSGNVYFVRSILPPEDTIKAQAMIGMCYLGIGGGVGSILSGAIFEMTNLTTLLTVAFLFSLLGLIVLFCGEKLFNKKVHLDQ